MMHMISLLENAEIFPVSHGHMVTLPMRPDPPAVAAMAPANCDK